jgi:hypothetical protein
MNDQSTDGYGTRITYRTRSDGGLPYELVLSAGKNLSRVLARAAVGKLYA